MIRPAPRRGRRRCDTQRRARHAHENHERWLVSYADFITLLFAFFVVMFATSQVNKKKVSRIAEVYSAHLKGEKPAADLSHTESGPAATEEPAGGRTLATAEVRAIRERIEQRLAGPISDEKIAVSEQPRGLVLSLREAAFFDQGRETFRPGGVDLLKEIGAAIREFPNQPIRLEGHTDDVPIQTEKFPSNWELSTARAVEVLRLLTTTAGIPTGRMSVAGYGEHRPVKTNATVAGRAANRRVDIVILSKSAAAMAPRQRLDGLKGGEIRRSDSSKPLAATGLDNTAHSEP